ncbi:twin transmembrane helix small protein [Palleronia caenipelagi]|uniref:Twin transmembrane helix small protein n=1 Tax=Palleronia caenipelagi TaxID=2489174 RepID=A0A547PMQ3_9RHOB|nr:twin transmembrane helix small protein [Palleronia caenipelagi]TRD15406.1 twin transmembrane helix small protein [Palleronia caenipelagi]
MLSDPLFVVAAIAVGAVAVILLLGISGFGKPGEAAAKRSNKYMRWRIYAQALAIVLVLLFVAVRRMGG